MTLETSTTIGLAYDNLTKPGNISAIVTSGVTSWVPGFGPDNFKYESPQLIAKTASVPVSTERIIEFQFGSSMSPRVFGLINHNLFAAAYTTAIVEYWTGSAWSAVVTCNLINGDPPLLTGWTNVVSASRWRFRLDDLGGNFYIGSVFWGSRYFFAANPKAAFIHQSQSTSLIAEETAGGAKHIVFGGAAKQTELEITWERASLNDADFLRKREAKTLVGVIFPEHADQSNLWYGQPVFFGFMRGVTFTPRGPGGQTTAQKAKYDLTLSAVGAA